MKQHPIIVQKFGGTSVSDIAKIKGVAQKIVSTVKKGNQVVVVVSAMGNTTNELLSQAHKITSRPPRRELDMLLTVGERISMALLSMAIHDLGYEAISFTGSQSGIITNDSHSNARIIDVRPYRIQDELARGKIVIVAGYQGVSYKSEITTLGRGGSDTTAVALSAALGAQACEIYSDVDGVFSANPKIIPEAVKLEELTNEQMTEMSRYGAKVLNREALSFAKRNKIKLYAKSTTLGQTKGTLIHPDGFPKEHLEKLKPLVQNITGRQDVLFISLDNASEENLSLLTEEFQNRQVLWIDINLSYKITEKSTRTIELAFTQEEIPSWPEIKKRLDRQLDQPLRILGPLSLLVLVGHEVGSTAEITRRVLKVCRNNSIEPVLLRSQSNTVVVCVPNSQLQEIKPIIYSEFIK